MSTRHYGKGKDGLSVRSIDLPDGKTGWVIDREASPVLDTRRIYPTRAVALEALAELRLWWERAFDE